MDMTWPKQITVLSGGVGAAKFLTGLVSVFPENRVTAIVNTADDIIIHGLHVSPDIDIITYSLAGIVNESKGWGIAGDTFRCMEMLERIGRQTWFRLGDKDIAIQVVRTEMLQKGHSLSRVTDLFRKAFGLKCRIVPMTDSHVETRIITNSGDFHFQEYLVKRRMRDRIDSIGFRGMAGARASPYVISSIARSDLVILSPSNPFVSIGTILSVEHIRETLRRRTKPTMAISPIIGGKVVKGPLGLMLKCFGKEITSLEVARMYRDIIDAFVIDKRDSELRHEIRRLGIAPFVTDTFMAGHRGRARLAKQVLEFSMQLHGCT